MNPLIHGELSWLTSQKLDERRDRLLVTLAGISPDIDGLTLLGGEEMYGKWHHVLTHGALSAVILSGIFTLFARRKALVFVLCFLAFHLHLLCDLAGSGPGWPIYYLWPFSRAELMWSGQWNLASWQNSVIGLAITLTALWFAMPLGRTVFELFSAKYDAVVVTTLRKRFQKGEFDAKKRLRVSVALLVAVLLLVVIISMIPSPSGRGAG
ncbi:MAG: metal-dependent hydrolase [Archangium sp.]|nr:metal-dependent hydrolase [Archangium sp.]